MNVGSLVSRTLALGAIILSLGTSSARAQGFDSDSGNSAFEANDDDSNGAPSISGVSLPPVVLTNDLLTVGIVANDPDGDILTPSCVWKKNGVVIAGESGVALDLSRPNYGDKGNVISVVASVNDGHGGVATAPEISVTVGNTPPTIGSVTIDNLSPKTNDILTAQCSARDVDGDALTTTFQWQKNGVNIAGATKATLDLSQSGNGDKGDLISVVAKVSDGTDAVSAPSSAVKVLNTPPAIDNNGAVSTWVGRAVMGRPVATDADGDPLRFSATTTAPTSGTLGGVDPSDGLFLYRPGSAVGTASFPIQVSDGESSATTTMLVAVDVAPAKGTQIYTALGDSTALGRGTSFDRGYSAEVERMLENAEGTGGKGWRLSVRAVSAFSALDTLRKVGGQSMLSLALADNPAVMTVWLGLNDGNRIARDKPALETLAQFSSAYGTIITSIAAKTKAKVVVCDVPNMGQLPSALIQSVAIRAALSQTSTQLQTSIKAALQGVRPGFARVVLLGDPGTRANFTGSDGFHPNEAGYTLVATKMFAALAHDTGFDFSPFVVALAPNRAQDAMGTRRTFQLVVRDTNGAADLSQIELLINTRLDAGTGAYLLYSPQTRLLSLRAGRTWLGPIHTGTRANPKEILDNGAIRIAGRDVVAQFASDGTTLFLSLPLTTGTQLVGQNTAFVRVKDSAGRTALQSLAADAGYVRAGTYIVLPVKGK